MALFAGATGLKFTAASWPTLRACCAPADGSSWSWASAASQRVAEMLAGWNDLRIEPDLAGIPRVIAARRP